MLSNLKERSVEHKVIKLFDLIHTPDLLGWAKRSDNEIVPIKCAGNYILLELSDLIGFVYD